MPVKELYYFLHCKRIIIEALHQRIFLYFKENLAGKRKG